MTFQLTAGGVVRDGTAFIPSDPGNRDWQEYLAWLKAGNTPQPADAPAVPTALQKLTAEKLGALLIAKRLIQTTDIT